MKWRGVGICLCMIFLLLVVGYFFYKTNSYPRVEFEIEDAELGDSFDIYYLDKDMENFDEAHKINEKITSESYQCIFHVPDKNMNKDKLRIDFGSTISNFRISSVKIKTFFTEKEISAQFMENCDFSVDVGKVSVEEDMLSVESIGNDPFIILNRLNKIDSKFYWNIDNFLLVCFFSIIIVYIIISKKKANILCINKKHAVIVSLVLFLTHRIIFFVKHIGFFAIDEFFHISTLNPDYITDYDRAIYIDYLVKVICKIFGQSDLTVKLVPVILGVISFGCCLYLCYQIYDNPYWIITICAIVTYMPYIIFNHFYIRMYIFLETILMLDCVLLYNAQKKKGTKLEKVNLLLCCIITGFYSIYTKDFSAIAIIGLLLVALLYHFLCNIKSAFCDKRLLLKMGGGLIFLVSIVIVLFVKLKWWEIFEGMFREDYEYRDDSPVLVKFVLTTIFYISIPFIVSLIYTWKKRGKEKSLYIIAALPLLGYMVVFYNGHMLRNCAAFLPIICIMAYLVFDKIKLSLVYHLMIILCAIGLTIHIEPNFWKVPTIPRETMFENVGSAVARAKELEVQGYELVVLLPAETYLAYFDLLDSIHLNIFSAGLADEIEPMFKSDRKIVFVANALGLYYLNQADWRTWGQNKCVEERYAGESCVIILN